jgi:hypothetical protein
MSAQRPEDPFAIQSLVTAANRQIMHDAAKGQPSESPARKFLGSVPWFKIGLLAVALTVLFQQAGDIRRQLVGVSQATIELEAASILGTARAAVDQHRKSNSEWPDGVPLAALDAMVSMERTGESYRLELILNGKTWQMDQNGTVTGGKQ